MAKPKRLNEEVVRTALDLLTRDAMTPKERRRNVEMATLILNREEKVNDERKT